MKKRIAFLLLVFIMCVSAFGCGNSPEGDPKTDPLEAFYSAIESDYPLSVMEALSQFGTNGQLGFRTAGSTAELAAAEYLYNEMQSIGLQNVVKDKLTVDSWEFEKAEMTFEDERGGEQTIIMSSYATQYVSENEELQLVYVGKGTDADYAELDVSGKLALIDINQAEEWWINWPAYQAKLKGAKAVIAVNTGGYFQYDEDTLGVQDVCGPKDAPAFNVTIRDGNMLKRLIEDSEDKEISVKLTANSVVTEGKAAYAVIGEIPGTTEEVLYMIAHYDGYFHTFEDNASGVGAVMGIAKALTDSGYQPRKTIRIVFHPAEEWGITDSRYDWATGAYLTVKKNLEWVENAFALINIDGGVTSNMATGVEVGASWELRNFAMDIGFDVEGNPFSDFEVVSPTSSWTEDFSYSQRGIPVLCSGYAGVEDQFTEVYHSSKDTKEYFYNEDAVRFSQKLYGTYLIELDRLLVKPLDFVELFEGLQETIDETAAGTALTDAVKSAIEAADDLNNRIETSEWDEESAAEFNFNLFKISKALQEKLISLTWEDELVFAHERYLNNASAIKGAVEDLQKGDGDSALEKLASVDLTWYACNFDRQTYDYFVTQVLSEDSVNSWGSGYIKDCADLYDTVRAIQAKAGAEKTENYRSEMEALDIELINQQKLLKDTFGQMTKDTIAITKMIERAAANE